MDFPQIVVNTTTHALKQVFLNDGVYIPYIGYGTGTTWHGVDNDSNRDGVSAAIQSGFHIDTADIYGNADSTGNGLILSGLDRSDIFLTTKLNEFSDPRDLLDSQLEKLKTDYVDLLLIQNPPKDADIGELWSIFEEMHAEGKAKSIGVSNFNIKALEKVLQVAKIRPVLNQIEIHPHVYAKAKPIIKFCHNKNIKIAACGTMTTLSGCSDVENLCPAVHKIAKRMSENCSDNISAGQVLMQWALQEAKADIIVTTTSKVERMTEYLSLDRVPFLTQEEIEELNDIGGKTFYYKHVGHTFE